LNQERRNRKEPEEEKRKVLVSADIFNLWREGGRDRR
jgi:hypothetical protein